MSLASNIAYIREHGAFMKSVKDYEAALAMQLLVLTGREWRWNGTTWQEIQPTEPNPFAAAMPRYSDYDAIRAYEEFGDGVFEPGEDPAPGIPF